MTYLSSNDLIFGTNGGGPDTPPRLDFVDWSLVMPPGLVGNLRTIFSVVFSTESVEGFEASGLKPGGNREASVSMLSKSEDISSLKSGLVVVEEVVEDSSALNPGGKKALISSNLIFPKTESFGFELVDSCLELVVDVVLGLSDLKSLGGFGRLRLGLKSAGLKSKSSGKSFSRSSCSMLDKISSIKLASVLVLVVDSSNLNPGGRNLDTSSETIFVVAGFL